MDAMLDDLTQALERAEEEGRRTRTLSELAGTIDFDEVLSRTLDTASALAGVDAALVALHALGPKPIVATIGLSEHEAEQPQVVGPPDGRPVRSVRIQYEYLGPGGAGRGRRDPRGPRGAAVGRLRRDRLPHRLLALSRARASPRRTCSSSRSSPAARAPRSRTRTASGRPASSPTSTRSPASTTAATSTRRSSARSRAAHRYSRRLALIVFDVDDFKAINDRIGHLAGDAVLAEASDRVRSVVRSADIACRVGGDEFAVILPESTLDDADQLYRRLLEAISSRPIGGAGKLQISAGIAELRSDEDATRFFQRGDDGALPGEGGRQGPGRRGEHAWL